MATKPLPKRRHLKPETSKLTNQTIQSTQQAAASAKETAYSIPILTQHGVQFINVEDPCSLLSSNDDPRNDDTTAEGIQGLDWSQVDMSLLANCTEMPSGAPSSFTGDRGEVFCASSGSVEKVESVVVKYVYRVEVVNDTSTEALVEELEGRMLQEMKNLCDVGSSEESGFVSIESAPDDKVLGNCQAQSPCADGCLIIDGAVTLNIDSSVNKTVAVELASESIAKTIDNGAFIDPNTMPEVVGVQYLDKTYEDYLVNSGGGSSITCPSAPQNITNKREVTVTYFYKVETDGAQSSSEFLPKLEQKILKELVGKCQSEGYTLVGIKSAPDDVEVSAGHCTTDSTNADECYLIDGALTLEIDSSSNATAAEETIRESIINAMDNDNLLDTTTMPEVVKVQYLDETYEDYLVNIGGGSSISCPSVQAGTSSKEVLVTYVYEVEAVNASAPRIIPKLEQQILKQLVEGCDSESYTLIGVESIPDDVEVSIGRCKIDSPDADSCHVIDGALTVEVDSSSNSTAVKVSVQESIISAMDNDALLDPTTMPEVITVKHLNETYEDYIKNMTIKSISCNISDLLIRSPNSTKDLETKTVPVTYLYEVETANVSSASLSLPIVEENLLMELGEQCEMLMMYGVVDIRSTPDDVEKKTGPCSIESLSADNCFVIEGGLTLNIISLFNSTWADNQTHSIIRNAMNNDDLLNSTTIPEVIKVRYLNNNTFDSFMGGFTSKDGDIIVVIVQEKGRAGAIAGIILSIILLLLLLLFCRRRKRKQIEEVQELELRRNQESMVEEMERDFDIDLDDLVADIDGATANRTANLSGDPPGHFHLGNHHYTADGVRYWSPNCALCVAAKACSSIEDQESESFELQEAEVAEEVHDFDELSYDLSTTKKFTDFSIHDLGKHHSSMHVRECKSTTCQGCKENLSGVVFIQSKKPTPTNFLQQKKKKKSVML